MVEAMDWVSAHQGPAADRGGGGLLRLLTLPPFIARAHTCLEGQLWTVACLIPLHWLFCLSLHRIPSKYFCFWAFYAHFRLKTNVFLQFISKKLFCRHQHQPYFLLLLFQLSHIKTKQQTPLTLIDICIATRAVSSVCCLLVPRSTIIIHCRTPSRANSDKLYFLHLLISLSLYMLAVTMYKGATFEKTFNIQCCCKAMKEHHTF